MPTSLAAALQMDMSDWFTPTVENFFGRVSKLQIANALTGAGNPLQPEDSKTKKGERAAIAAKKIDGTGWLPEPLRLTSTESAGEANAVVATGRVESLRCAPLGF